MTGAARPDAGERLFRRLLWVYPTAFRRRFADEMVEYFVERRLEQYRRGRGTARLWAHLIADLALSAPLLHARALATRAVALRPATSGDVPWSAPDYPAETHPMDTLRQDIRYALRTLLHRPAHTMVAIVTLALGIGATTAIYSVVDAVLVRPLPWPHGERLVLLEETRDGKREGGSSYLDFLDWQANNHSFEEMGVIRGQSVNLTGGESPERVIGSFVTASTFRLLGAAPARGRLFSDSETTAGIRQPIAVISYGLWQSHFGGRDDVIGRTVMLNGDPLVIVGVLRQGVRGLQGDPDVWMPIGYYPNRADLTVRGRSGVGAYGRLRPGVTVSRAGSDIGAIAAQLAHLYPGTNASIGVAAADLKEELVGSSRSQVLIVFGAVAIVLLIACANVANLQLAQAAIRRRELSVRSALGAPRVRLVRQLLTENLVLSLAGGLLGVAVAYAATRWLAQVVPDLLQLFGAISLDRPVLFFAAASTIGTGVLFGFPPAWKASRVRLQDALALRTSSGGGGQSSGRRSVLVLAQIGLCMVLLITAGLLTRSYSALSDVNPGFDPAHVLTLQFRLPPTKYDRGDKITTMFTRTLDELRRVPGVEHAALVRATPLNGNGDAVRYQMEGRGETDARRLPSAQFNIVSGDYFATMRIPLIGGRDFTVDDRMQAAPVAIVNAQLAAKLAPTGSAIGKRITIGEGPSAVSATVIGVVGNTKQFLVSEAQLDQIYAFFAQTPLIFTEAVVRSAGDPMAIAAAARSAIWRVDRDQPVWRVRGLLTAIEGQFGSRTFLLRLLAAFAFLAVALAVIGIYGVTSFSVAGRAREMGIRLALGAEGAQVVGLVVRDAMVTIGMAIGIGLVASVGVSQLIRAELFGIEPIDPLVYATVPVVLGGVALLACYLPARRASRVDPAMTLRSD